MIDKISKRVSAEYALYRHNKHNKKGVVSAEAQDFHVLENILPQDVYQGMLASLASHEAPWVRSETSWRKGAAIGGHELRSSPMAEWLTFLESDDFLAEVRQRTGLEKLDWVPMVDTNRLSLLLYQGDQDSSEGDGIDWHVDGSIYLGDRWAGILTLVETSSEDSAKLELKPHGQVRTLAKSRVTNSLVLFRGDHVEHRVRPMLCGDKRIVLSLLFSTWPVRTLNPALRRYQSRVNQTFYGNPAP